MNLSIRKSPLAYGLLAAGLLGAFGMLYMKTRAVDFDQHNAIVATMRDLKQIDADWNVDVLRTKTGLASNYDRVASPLPLIARLDESLGQQTGRFWQGRGESAARLQPLLARYRELMDHKVNAIEQFKSQNAILRNSSRFLPVAASDLLETTREADVARGLRSEIERTLNALLADTMSYSLAPDAPLRERVDAAAQRLAQLTAPLPEAARERAQTLEAHVGTVLRQQDSGAALLAQLSALPTARAIDELADAHAAEHELLLSTQQLWRQALFAYSAALLALLGVAAWRVWRYYRLLNDTNAALARTNHELKESHVQLVQAEKMSALGQMVAGIAHEINTPLAYVKGTFGVLNEQLQPVQLMARHVERFLSLLRAPTRDKAALTVELHAIDRCAQGVVEYGLLEGSDKLMQDGIHGIDQISEIVLNLKNFSRLDRAKVSEFSVEAGLDSTLLLARNLLKNSVEVRKEYGHVPAIHGSPSQINQVFLNIITNAVHAMPQREQPNVITLRTQADENEVRIEIQDNGCGIAKDVLPRIFDPFFTTKPIGEGTGMGLSISYKIVQEHQGRILVDTEPDIGTVFTIVLPIRAAAAASAAVEAEPLPLAA